MRMGHRPYKSYWSYSYFIYSQLKVLSEPPA